MDESGEGEMTKSEREREELESLLPVDLLEVEVGYELVPLVDGSRDGALLGRITESVSKLLKIWALLFHLFICVTICSFDPVSTASC